MKIGYENAAVMFEKEKDGEGSFFVTASSYIFLWQCKGMFDFWCLGYEIIVVMQWRWCVDGGSINWFFGKWELGAYIIVSLKEELEEETKEEDPR